MKFSTPAFGPFLNTHSTSGFPTFSFKNSTGIFIALPFPSSAITTLLSTLKSNATMITPLYPALCALYAWSTNVHSPSVTIRNSCFDLCAIGWHASVGVTIVTTVFIDFPNGITPKFAIEYFRF